MYQIFVVEDELLIRQSLRNTIENMKGPYAFCGEASDGELALSMMQDLMPDILSPLCISSILPRSAICIVQDLFVNGRN